MLKGKTVILGVTGSIAAYKAANLASMLRKAACGCAGHYDKECDTVYESNHI